MTVWEYNDEAYGLEYPYIYRPGINNRVYGNPYSRLHNMQFRRYAYGKKKTKKKKSKKAVRTGKFPRIKGKGDTKNLRETKFLIKNLNYGKLPPDVTRKITRNYTSNLIKSRLSKLNKRKLLIKKIENYIEIINNIHDVYDEEILGDDGYNYISNKNSLINILKNLKKQSKKSINEKYIDTVEKILLKYYKEIDDFFQSQIEQAEYGNNILLNKLDRFLRRN